MTVPVEDGALKAKASYAFHAPIFIMGDSEFTAANGVTGGSGTSQDPFVISGWEIDATDDFGIYIAMTTAHYVIRGVHTYGSGSMGVAIYAAPNGAVAECLMDEGYVGVIALQSSDLNITGNYIVNQLLFGIEVATCERIDITLNMVLNSDGVGIVCMDADEVNVVSNTCSIAGIAGIVFMEAYNCRIADNDVSGNDFSGIMANDTAELTIEGNEISHNTQYGLALGNSTGVQVFHNSFIDNGIQAWHDNCTVTWDAGYPTGGNYWSDYTGPDSYSGPDQDVPGPDGIGDIPYVTHGGGIDRYPWMTPDFVPIPEFGMGFVPVLVGACALPVAIIRLRRRR